MDEKWKEVEQGEKGLGKRVRWMERVEKGGIGWKRVKK